MNAISINFQNFVQIQNSQIVTTSEFVAQAFGKEHKNLLARIEQISKEIKASFFELNFKPKAKQVKTGFGFRETKSYELTKDGFMLLVMGFTGKQAMAIKIAYIEAFNAMSKAILDLNNTVSDGIKPAKTTADDRTGLRQAVAALVGRKGIDYSSAYSMIHQRFNVEAIEDIPAEKLPEAVAYAHALTLHTGLTGEVLDAPPKAEPKLPIDGNSLADIAAMVYYGTWMIELGKDISAPLKQLGNRQAVTMWTVWHETRSILKRTVAALEVLRGYADKDTSDRIAGCLEGIYSKATVR
ncbi:Rha family transcriptional regulator [Neisseria cinerea]|uniref:Rha family transcriptional regulator n=1 Tax=Neisseria cinerea TaxID=483 RepID=A0A7T3ETY2_NEICI|nr:Rha family transcriptional regulator [Neisseria cinerea]QPT37454.1 Rha family transcriptional regulator [Neisseria cinerea]SQF83121.1 phage associated protein [Neisseria cinerea]